MSTLPHALGQDRRIIWLAIVCAGIGLLLVGRLASWQLLPHPEVAASGLVGSDRANSIVPTRGSILDVNGQYLAASTVEYTIAVSPRLLSRDQKSKLLPVLSGMLGLPPEVISKTLQSEDSEYAVFGGYGKRFSVWVAEQIEQLDERNAFNTEISSRRVYPDGGLAAAMLGFIPYLNPDLAQTGQYGIEQYYNDVLRGTKGTWRGISDPWGNPVLMLLGGYVPAKDGADLVLCVDRNVQYAAEAILLEGIQENRATSGNIVVLDPKTGAVLAMANYPSYDPATYEQVKSADYYINSAISSVYEPGSVFKPLTLAAALEARVIRPTDTYDDRGEITVGQQRIMNSDRLPHGRTTMTELLAYSRNVGAAYVATLLGPARFYELIRRFGFGEITGVDLALESTGSMRVPGNPYWHMSDLGTNSFGQGIAVTPLQVVAAYGALANDGVLMRPYVVSQVREGTAVSRRAPFATRRVISSEVAQQITEMMANAVELGTDRTLLPGYRIAGKSGTSGIPDVGGYGGREVIASFIGFGPLPNPRFVILVKYDRPKEGYWGLDVAAPAFTKMGMFLVDYYGLPPTQSVAQATPNPAAPGR